MFATPKRHILALNCVFWHSLRQNPSRGLGCSELQEPKKPTPFGVQYGAQSQRYETPGQIVTNYCTSVWVHDVITSANFYDCHIRGFGVVWGQINFGLLH